MSDVVFKQKRGLLAQIHGGTETDLWTTLKQAAQKNPEGFEQFLMFAKGLEVVKQK